MVRSRRTSHGQWCVLRGRRWQGLAIDRGLEGRHKAKSRARAAWAVAGWAPQCASPASPQLLPNGALTRVRSDWRPKGRDLEGGARQGAGISPSVEMALARGHIWVALLPPSLLPLLPTNSPRNLGRSGPYHSMAARGTTREACVCVERRRAGRRGDDDGEQQRREDTTISCVAGRCQRLYRCCQPHHRAAGRAMAAIGGATIGESRQGREGRAREKRTLAPAGRAAARRALLEERAKAILTGLGRYVRSQGMSAEDKRIRGGGRAL